MTLLLDRFKELPQSETILRLDSRANLEVLEIRTKDMSYVTITEAMTYSVPILQTVEVRMVNKSWAREYYQMKGWGELPKLPDTGTNENIMAGSQDGINVVFLESRGV